MTVKEYLTQIQDLEEKVIEQKEYVQTLRESLTLIGGGGTDTDKVQSSGTSKSKLEDAIIKIVDAESVLKKMEEHLGLLKIQIAEQIHSMDDLKLNTLLKLRYIDWKKYGNIRLVSDEMGYSYDYTKELHRDALKVFEDMFPHLTP